LLRTLPGPTASTLPRCGLFLALSGKRMPPLDLSFASSRRMTIRSPSGLMFMRSLSILVVDLPGAVANRVGHVWAKAARASGTVGCGVGVDIVDNVERRHNSHPAPEPPDCLSGSPMGPLSSRSIQRSNAARPDSDSAKNCPEPPPTQKPECREQPDCKSL